MLHRGARVAALLTPLFLVYHPAPLYAQPAPRQFFYVCYAQAPPAAAGGAISFYLSGVLQGPQTAAQTFRADFGQFLMQRYSFKGAAVCAPAATEANAQQVITQRSTALRNNPRWNVVETGWTESAEAAAPAPAPAAQAGGTTARATPNANAATPATTGRGTPAAGGGRPGAASPTTPADAASNTGGGAPNQSRASNGGGGTDPAVEVANVIGAIFGTNTGGRNGNGANNNTTTNSTNGSGTGGRQSQAASGRANNASGNAGNNANGNGGTQNTASQVSSTLKNAFSSSNNAARGNQPAAGGNAPSGLPNGALGAAQFGTTKLVVYGCGRQQEQIACVTDLTNENAKDSLVQSAEIWKDAFIVDDRGDRHQRTNGFFLNIDGEQRQQLDISYGKTAKFILMFDNVQTRVQKVALRSPSGGLDVEEIGVISPDAGQGGAAAK